MNIVAQLAVNELLKWERWAVTTTQRPGESDVELRQRITADLQELREWRKWAAELGQPADAADASLRREIAAELAEWRECSLEQLERICRDELRKFTEIDNGT